ncbi:Uncharacterised protein [Chlamydia trachomatis]|nr:Uncharacterised protein [Chlamydia trachomatis]
MADYLGASGGQLIADRSNVFSRSSGQTNCCYLHAGQSAVKLVRCNRIKTCCFSACQSLSLSKSLGIGNGRRCILICKSPRDSGLQRTRTEDDTDRKRHEHCDQRHQVVTEIHHFVSPQLRFVKESGDIGADGITSEIIDENRSFPHGVAQRATPIPPIITNANSTIQKPESRGRWVAATARA